MIPVIYCMKNTLKNNFMRVPVVVSWNVEAKNQIIFRVWGRQKKQLGQVLIFLLYISKEQYYFSEDILTELSKLSGSRVIVKASKILLFYVSYSFPRQFYIWGNLTAAEKNSTKSFTNTSGNSLTNSTLRTD